MIFTKIISAAVRYFIVFVYAFSIVSASGFFDVAQAVISCSDVLDPATGRRYSDEYGLFVYRDGKTYAISKTAVGDPQGAHVWESNITRQYIYDGISTDSLLGRVNAGRYGAARPVSIKDQAMLDFIVGYYKSYLGVATDQRATYLDAWKEKGAVAVTTMSGAIVPFANWAAGHPLATVDPLAVVMGADGKMYTTPDGGVKLSQIVEFDGKLDCSLDSTPIINPPVDPNGGTGTGTGDTETPNLAAGIWCGSDLNGNGFTGDTGEMGQCLSTAQGNLCPVAVLDCDPTYQPAQCPGTSVLDTVRDMCQAPLVEAKCPNGYSYDSFLDRCTRLATCSGSGILNTVTDQCEVVVSNQCPDSTYTYNSTLDKCIKAVECENGGVYSPERDRCELSLAGECPSGFTMNFALQRCQKDPVCPAGTTYLPQYDKCISADAVCPADYNWDTTRQRCEKAPPECVAGTLYNPTTNKCEANPTCASGTYNATANACTYTATLSGGVVYNLPLYTSSTGGNWLFMPGCPATLGCTGVYGYGNNVSGVAVYDWEGPLTTDSGHGPFYGYVSGSDLGGFRPVYNTSGVLESSGAWGLIGYLAPSPGTYGGTYSCPSGGTLAGSTCTKTATCPAGTALDGASDKCVANPTCTGGTFDGTADVCFAPKADCSSGLVLDGVLGKCSIAPDCAVGVLNVNTDKCEVSPACGSGYTFNQAQNRCELTPPPCPAGSTYSATYNKCMKAVQVCENGYSWSTTRQRCEKTPPECGAGTSYNLTTNKCEATPTCASGTYNPATNQCESGGSYAATLQPVSVSGSFRSNGGVYGISGSGSTLTISGVDGDGGRISRTLNLTSTSYSCPSGGTLSGTTCDTTSYSSATCPSGTTLDGASDKCVANPTCTGGTFDGTTDVCYYTAAPCETSANWGYDSAAGQCSQAVACPNGGTLSPDLDICTISLTDSCLPGWTKDLATGLCYSSAVCNNGAYVLADDRCEATITRVCADGYAWNPTISKCSAAPVCQHDPAFSLDASIGYAPSIDKCSSQAEHICEAGLTWNGVPVNKCEAVPICAGAVYYDAAKDQCYMGDNSCPHGAQYTCMSNPNMGGKRQCSPFQCFETASADQADTGAKMDDKFLRDDAKDDNGNCLGQIYIFSGKPSRCRPAGWTVGYINNCCADGKAMAEDMGDSWGGLVMSSGLAAMSDIAKGAYNAYQGYQTAQNVLLNGGTTGGAMMEAGTQVMEQNLSGAAADGFMAGAEGATQGKGMISSVAGGAGEAGASAGQAAAGAAVVWGAGALATALGGDQDTKAGAQIAATAGLYAASQMFSLALMTGPQAIIGIIIIVVMRVLMGSGCDENDITTANFNESKRCHFVGTYCEKKWALVGCVQQAKGYCCFNSLLARIMHEQARPQFPGVLEWGQPDKPNCRGFTPEEFESIDFSRVDLHEYLAVVESDINSKVNNVQQSVSSTLERRMNDISSGMADSVKLPSAVAH